eukprot:747554-Pyramimonas_sp.AAC.1
MPASSTMSPAPSCEFLHNTSHNTLHKRRGSSGWTPASSTTSSAPSCEFLHNTIHNAVHKRRGSSGWTPASSTTSPAPSCEFPSHPHRVVSLHHTRTEL